MILYIENSKDSTQKKPVRIIYKFSKDAKYKINTKKTVTFLYTNNGQSEEQIKETIPFTIATKRIKYIGINLPRETKDLYAEKMKEIKDDTNRWRDIPCSWYHL